MNRTLASATALGLMLTAHAMSPAVAGTIAFTWDPSRAAPPLTTGPAAFNADMIAFDNHVYSVVQPDNSFVSHRIVVVTGFSLNGNAVTPAGFGSTYGLYFDVVDTGSSAPPLGVLFY